MSYSLPQLPYEFNALEPYIDENTMRIHYTKHHQSYIDKLNDAVKQLPSEWLEKPVEELLTNLDQLPANLKSAVQNNGGGHWNHSFFWELLSAENQSVPTDLEDALKTTFGSIDSFKAEFTQAALTRFGSGWAWLSIDHNKNLIIHSTANQDCPLSEDLTPLLGLDVWEHAYYLNYQNKRQEYVEAFWNIINWNKVAEHFRSL